MLVTPDPFPFPAHKKEGKGSGLPDYVGPCSEGGISKYQKKTSEHMKPRQSFSGCLKGSRIVNLDNLQEFIDQLMAHASQCDSQIILSGEKKAGLASIVSSRCSRCNYNVPLKHLRK